MYWVHLEKEPTHWEADIQATPKQEFESTIDRLLAEKHKTMQFRHYSELLEMFSAENLQKTLQF
jgi:hypothetical protein